MKNKTLKSALAILIMGSLTACDFLDIAPLDSYTEDNIFSDAALTEAYVTKHYTLPRNGFNQSATRMVTDECMCNFNQWAWGYPHDIVNGYMTPDFVGGYSTWSEYYANIKDCNIFFDNMDKVNKIPEENRTLLIGEMTFFRAYYYMDLVSRFGGVPYITRVFELDDANMMIPRNSYEDCVDSIADEFKKAADLLPLKHSGDNFGRVTKGAALAMRARLLLYAASPLWNPNGDKSKWEAAAKAAKEVIDLGIYSLDKDYKGMFLNPFSPEIIFERLFTTEYGAEWVDQKNSPNGMGGWAATCILQDMVDSYEMEDGSMPDPSMYENAVNDPWQGREPRFYASIACDGQQYRGRELEFWLSEDGKTGGLDSKLGNEGWNATQTGYIMRKFMDEGLIPNGSNWDTNSKQPWIYCRLGEVYLNYAEAMYHCGEEKVAREYVNEIRKRARNGKEGILPDVTESGEALLAKIQHERKIELAFEEHRFFDVRRWKIAEDVMNKPGMGIKVTKKENGEKSYAIIPVQADRKFMSPQHYLLPIPRSEIQKNELLKQNEGYK